VLGLLCVLSACHWQDAKEVIAMADSIDQNHYVIYDDTAALGQTIRTLDNPFGRLLMSNTLGKAYYYMGRNHSLSNRIAEAADCYIEADRLQIDDAIYRGRINSCMGYICAQNNSDSLALIFFERASRDFRDSGEEWRYAHSLLDKIEFNIKLHHYIVADSLLQIAQTYYLDSAYQARYYETCGLYFYEQQQYDSALVRFHRGVDYWQYEEEKCFSYMKIMQANFKLQKIDSAIYYAKKIVAISQNPNYKSNAYYCLMLQAKQQNNTEQLSLYASAREDMNRILEQRKEPYTQSVTILGEYLFDPFPHHRMYIVLTCITFLCLLCIVCIFIYRNHNRMAHAQIDLLSEHVQTQQRCFYINQQLLEFENNRLSVLAKYHTPHKRWKKYSLLQRDVDFGLHDWLMSLNALPLSEQEKIFCTISLIYPHMTDVEIADFICYGKEGIRVFKNRILKKLEISSSDFPDFLRNLSIPK
jgi:tetratricopeptide (TPR) repeat protein